MRGNDNNIINNNKNKNNNNNNNNNKNNNNNNNNINWSKSTRLRYTLKILYSKETWQCKPMG